MPQRLCRRPIHLAAPVLAQALVPAREGRQELGIAAQHLLQPRLALDQGEPPARTPAVAAGAAAEHGRRGTGEAREPQRARRRRPPPEKAVPGQVPQVEALWAAKEGREGALLVRPEVRGVAEELRQESAARRAPLAGADMRLQPRACNGERKRSKDCGWWG